MAVKVARGQVTIIDQNDAVSLQAFIGSSQPLTQVYNRDNNAYAPSYASIWYLPLLALRQRSGGDRPDHLGRQCRDAYGRREERLGQVVQERYGDRLRTGQLHHRRGIGPSTCPYRQSQPHDRFPLRKCVILSRRFTSTPTGWRFRSGRRFSSRST